MLNNVASVLLFLFLVGLMGCSKSEWDECEWPQEVRTEKARSSKPTVLVIGDSISDGYDEIIKSTLGARYDVIHNPCNAQTTGWSLQYIDEWLSIDDQYAAVTFNNGMHDLALKYGITDQTYEDGLRALAKRIKAKTPNAVFILTTSVPVGDYPNRIAGREVDFNNIAIAVMAQEGIPVVDLHAVSVANLAEQRPDDVHFSQAGYDALGTAILDELFSLFGIQ